MNHRRSAIVILSIAVSGVTMWFGSSLWAQRQWFDLQAQQMATIRRIEAFPPLGWEPRSWSNALVIPYNVWGNVTDHPSYSKISNAEMRSLLSKLEQILAVTTRDNSSESVDRVFSLLLQRGQKSDFISAYREEFRTSCKEVRRRTPAK